MARCRRGRHCALAEPITGGPSSRMVLQAAEIGDDERLCVADRRNLLRVLGDFPELYVLLQREQEPNLAVVYREVDITGSGSLYPPLVIDTHIEALASFADYELAAWAEFTADDLGIDWSTALEKASRQGNRIERSCRMLAFNFDRWLSIGERFYRARSLTERPADGHLRAPVVFDTDMEDWMVTRDAGDAAVLLMDLHRRAEEITGLAAVMRSPIPCRSCRRRTVERAPTALIWKCRECGDERSDRWHDDDMTKSEAATREAS